MTTLLFFCPKCQKTMSIKDADSSQTFRCMSCGGPLFFDKEPAPAKQEDATKLDPGTSFGDFEIIEVLGQGGMGMVYKAMNRALNRIVALKVLRPDFAEKDPEHEKRFEREAQSAAQLIHPNIVTIFSIGKVGNRRYIEMEFVPGKTSGDMVDEQGPLPLKKAIGIVSDAAKGLGAAHRQKIVHRDIKPDNLLLHPDGIAKVADFGLAKHFGPVSGSENWTSDITQTGIAVGTPHFMSPEQCEGEPLDGRSDIYSLGCTFYYLLTAAQPYRGKTTISVMRQHLFDPPPDVTIHRPEVPESVSNIIFKMMEKDVNKRYQTSEELLTDLSAVDVDTIYTAKTVVKTPTFGTIAAEDEPTSTTSKSIVTAAVTAPPPRPETAWPILLLLLVLIFMGLATIGGIIWIAQQPETAARSSTSTSMPAEPPTPTTVRPEPRPTTIDASTPPRKGPEVQGFLTKSFNSAILDLDILEEKNLVAAAGRNASIYLWNFEEDSMTTLRQEAPVRSVRFSPDGKYLVAAAGSLLTTWPTASFKSPRESNRKGEVYTAIEFSSDAYTLIAGSEKGVELWEFPSMTKKGYLRETPRSITTLDASREGFSLVAGDEGGIISYWEDFRRGGSPDVFPQKEKPIHSLSLSFDGHWLAASAPGQAFVINLGSKLIRPGSLSNHQTPHITLAPDGTYLVLGLDDGTVAFHDLTFSRQLGTTQRFHGVQNTPGSWFHELRFSRSGKWLMSSSDDGSIALKQAESIEF